MQGNDVFRFAVRVLKESIENVLNQAHLTIDHIDLIIHQANYRIINHVAKRMKVDLQNSIYEFTGIWKYFSSKYSNCLCLSF